MDFAKLVRLVKAAAAFIPQVIEIIKVVQASMPGDGRGAEKLAVARAFLESAWEVAADGEITFAEVWPYIEKAIARLVEHFKTNGTFTKPAAG